MTGFDTDLLGDGSALKASGILNAAPTVTGPLTLKMLRPVVDAVRSKPRPFVVAPLVLTP